MLFASASLSRGMVLKALVKSINRHLPKSELFSSMFDVTEWRNVVITSTVLLFAFYANCILSRCGAKKLVIRRSSSFAIHLNTTQVSAIDLKFFAILGCLVLPVGMILKVFHRLGVLLRLMLSLKI